MPMRLTRGWIEVDLDALVRNARAMQARATAILPMVKADAYGTGAVPVARVLERLAPWGYGVATIDEGVELRDAGISRPIVLFTSVEAEELSAVRDARLTPALASAADISSWNKIGGGAWHLAIDTGMSRAGVRWDGVRDLSALVLAHPPEGAFTHFHSASLDDGSRLEQEERFERALAALPAHPPLIHVENSAALARRDRSRWGLGRPGIFLYGVGSGAGAVARPEPVVAMRARIVEMRTLLAGETVSYDATFVAQRETRIATLPIGYADGYRRSLGNHAYALVAGHRSPVVGVVTMDMTMLDVTGMNVSLGDVVTLTGRDGDELLDVATLAELAGASPYEMLTGFHARLARHYSGGE
ncbi:MAG: alanine racemase [Gemmatimonadota bacterium]|nr:alanine racemase [Gemmatimonadota bacterium]